MSIDNINIFTSVDCNLQTPKHMESGFPAFKSEHSERFEIAYCGNFLILLTYFT